MRSLPTRLFRFASVGVVNGIIYGVFTSFFVSRFGLDGKIASVLGYLTTIPFAFYAHRSYTFGSRGAVKLEFRRFVITQAIGLLVSLFAMATIIDYFELHYSIGIIVAVVLVPIVNFLVLNTWVFSTRKTLDNAEE